MHAEPQTLVEIFSLKKRYFIPIYQRPYSWTITQWEGFFTDIQDAHKKEASNSLANVAKSHFMGAVVFSQKTENNDDYTIVDGQQRILTSVIFLAALLRIIKDRKVDAQFTENKKTAIKTNIYRLLNNSLNEFDEPTGDPSAYRLSPLGVDSKVYSGMMLDAISEDNSVFTISNNSHPIYQAYEYFTKQIREYLESYPNSDYPKMLSSFTTTVKTSLNFAVITIEKNENPQEIFESLNARAVALTSFDLIKNMFLMSAKSETTARKIYNKLEKFEDHGDENPFWTQNRSTSFDKAKNIQISNREIFLNYWLAGNRIGPEVFKAFEERKINPVNPTEDDEKDTPAIWNSDGRLQSADGVFWGFKKHMVGKSSDEFEKLANQISEDSKLYRKMLSAVTKDDSNDKLPNFFSHNGELKDMGYLISFVYRAIEKMENRSLWQIVFWLMRDHSGLNVPEDEKKEFIMILDSLMIRQFVVLDRVKSENLNQLLKNLIKELNIIELQLLERKENTFKISYFLKEIIRKKQPTQASLDSKNKKLEDFYLYSPSNDDVLNQGITKVYTPQQASRAKTILEEIESYKRGITNPLIDRVKSDNRCEADRYQLEHILPKSWAKSNSWKIDEQNLDKKRDLEKQRDRAKQHIGNFSLVSQPLNIQMSNKGWPEKKVIMKKQYNAGLFLIEELQSISEWDEDSIKTRSEELLKVIMEIWPEI